MPSRKKLSKDKRIERLLLELENSSKQVVRLENDLNSILLSKSWKVASTLSLLSQKIFPRNSKRRFFAKRIFRILIYPIKIILCKKQEKRVIINYEKITFKNYRKPLVSIIIPVYNQFDYTYNCLKALSTNSGKKVTYEIIVADDCSTDITRRIKKIIYNVRTIKTSKNIGFLYNCNNAAKRAKGKYILFLNNDTQVQDNWLHPLADLMEIDNSIGAVGSKFISQNGLLQEAGGILWADGSATNYGRSYEAGRPEYNYVKEVDYISGASLMIRRSIWNNLGGFDERFAPAYCEDSDICFSIRKLGYKVMYQPASVVIHFEGISNGTIISEGQKQYQEINTKKFFTKWKDTLEKEHFKNGEDIFFARDRSKNKKTILFIDHYVPWYDKDAGSKTIFQYLKLFKNIGFNIKFIGHDFIKHEPYTTTLNQMGIEVLFASYRGENWKKWLKMNEEIWKAWIKENGEYIDYVLLSRPHISINYIDEVKKNTNAKIFYYGHDLNFLRVKREYKIIKDNNLLHSMRKWKKIETDIMNKVDVTYYPSQIEIDEIKRQNPIINAKAIPAYLFEVRQYKRKDFEKTCGIMFIGGFNHKPNVDGVLWYINEIHPILKNIRPEIMTFVLGSNIPEAISNIKSESIVIVGSVTEEQLENYYTNCRLSIAPLRYGAGVKGKVVEAMYNQIPVVTTSIGAEGINGAKDCLFIKDDAVEFAEEIARVYDNYELLTKKSQKGVDTINQSFTSDAAIKILSDDFCL